MRKKSIDILIEISARCHEVCSYIGGFKIIIDSLIDLSADKIRYDYLISSILNVINTPENRRSFRDWTELTRIFSIFTVAEVNKKEIDEKTLSMMESKYFMAKQVILAMIRHWTGLLYLAADPTGIKSLVEALTQPILEVKKVAILDLFIEIFSQKIDNDPAAMMKSQDSILSYKQKIGTLVSNYMSFVLLAFIEGNLYDVLIELILSESSYKILWRAKFLLKRIMQMAFKILPNHPHLPFLIETATDFSVKSDEFTRSSVSKIIKELSEIPTLELANPFKRIKSNDEAADGAENYEVNDIAKETIVEFHDQRKVFFTCMEYYMHHPIGVPSSNEYLTPYSELKVLFSSDLDNRFRKKLNSTNVNNNKDYRQWKWDVILQLFESNILGDERILEEALKNKFMKRLLKFYLPMKKDFVTLEYSSENFIFAKVGYHLIKVLINSKVGRKVLASAQNINLVFGIGFQDSHDNIFKDATWFMQEIGELLTNEHKILSSILSKKPEELERKEKEREFWKERLNKTMMREFISWIGLFTTKIDGIRLLQRKNIFHTLKLLIDPSGINDTFWQIIIRSFDYRIDSDQRILLVEWLAKGSKHIKLEILEVFRTLYRSGASDFATWWLPILINYSFAGISEGNEARYCHPDVKTKALSILKEVIEDPVILDDIVNLPYFDHKHFDDDTFLIKWLSHPTALHNLHESGWIDQTLRKWKDSENLKFVKQVTTLLNEELIKGSTDFSESYSLVISNPVISLSEDLRNDAVMLKRFPFNLVVAIENSRSKTLFEEYIQSAIVVDPSGLTITGNTENSIKFQTPLCVANSGNKTKSLMEEWKEVYDDIYNVKVWLMIGKSYIDFKGQDIDLPYWINCDANTIKRKGETYRHPNVAKRMMLRVKKSGCMFIFEKINENKLLLQEIKMKIKFLPDKVVSKKMAPVQQKWESPIY